MATKKTASIVVKAPTAISTPQPALAPVEVVANNTLLMKSNMKAEAKLLKADQKAAEKLEKENEKVRKANNKIVSLVKQVKDSDNYKIQTEQFMKIFVQGFSVSPSSSQMSLSRLIDCIHLGLIKKVEFSKDTGHILLLENLTEKGRAFAAYSLRNLPMFKGLVTWDAASGIERIMVYLKNSEAHQKKQNQAEKKSIKEAFSFIKEEKDRVEKLRLQNKKDAEKLAKQVEKDAKALEKAAKLAANKTTKGAVKSLDKSIKKLGKQVVKSSGKGKSKHTGTVFQSPGLI